MALMTPTPIGRLQSIKPQLQRRSPQESTATSTRHHLIASLSKSSTRTPLAWLADLAGPHPMWVNFVNSLLASNVPAFRPNYSTTRRPWSVLLRRRPPSAVTVTMSSIRTPNLPAR